MNNTLNLDDIQVEFSYLIIGIYNFDYKKTIKWGEKYWYTCFFFIAAYLVLIYYGQQWMKSRQPHKLKKSLFFWNVCLSIFSLTGTCKLAPYIVELWTERNFLASVCTNPFEGTRPENYQRIGYWVGLFCLSKVFELGDTAFIVLRKKKLVFLHWYHHVTVLMYTWCSGRQLASTAGWSILANYSVHTVMYGYFAFKAANFKIPKVVAMVITIGQISQMVIALYVNWLAYGALKEGEKCHVRYENIIITLVMYASYWVLFVRLFYMNYLSKSVRKKFD